MSPIESYSRFNKEGKFRSTQEADELPNHEGIEMNVDPAYKGLGDYDEGDQIKGSFSGTLGAIGEDGKRQINVQSCDIEPMPGEAKKFRNEKKSNMPPPSTMEDEV